MTLGPIEVLVEAESDWSEQTEPLVFASEYGSIFAAPVAPLWDF